MAGSRSEMDRPDWIAVDWGTSRLRAWAMGDDGRPVAQAESEQGMGGLAPDAFEPALLALVGPWLDPDRVTPVVACGLVGARLGSLCSLVANRTSVPMGLQASRAVASPKRVPIEAGTISSSAEVTATFAIGR